MAAQSKPEKARVRKPLTQERLKELLHYDPETGIVTWVVDKFAGPSRKIKYKRAGTEAGCVVKWGRTYYRQIRIGYVLYATHQIAFMIMTGEIPDLIDHKDCDGSNNRWGNLRVGDKSKNAANAFPPSNNTSGIKGVYWDANRRRWVADVIHEKKKYRLGRFGSLESAAAAYAKKAKELFGEFARTS